MMGLPRTFSRWRLPRGGARVGRKPARRRFSWEALEGREMLSGAGTDFTLMGGQWDNSRPITYSIAPDGAAWARGTNSANATLDAEFAGTAWRADVARALQTWAVAANLDFAQVADGPYALNAQGLSQGDPRFGDIRIGGFNYGNASTIAQTYGPPPNGTTGGGDVNLNTSFNFAPGGRFDFETVVLHELGHSLGLGESPQPTSAMYTYYNGARQGLSPYDVEGIRSIYGPRVADAFQGRGQGTSASNAVDLSAGLDASNQAHINGVSLSTIGDVEYFSVVAPATAGGATLTASAQAFGFSLMSPKVTVIDPSTGTTLAVNSHPDQFGDTASVSIPGVQAGHRYLIAVTGATQDVFAVGSYAIQVGFNGGTPISAPTPTPTPAPIPAPTPAPVTTPVIVSTPTPTPTPTIQPDRFQANNSFATAAELGPWFGAGFQANMTITSASDVHVFAFEPTVAGTVFLASINTKLIVNDATGRQVASGTGLIGFQSAQAGARYFLTIVATDGRPVASFGFAIDVTPAPAPPVVAAALPAAAPIMVPTPSHITRVVHRVKAASGSSRGRVASVR